MLGQACLSVPFLHGDGGLAGILGRGRDLFMCCMMNSRTPAVLR